ncbi:MAG: hypothetical protein FWB80_10260 [Defluviitaleaceae bacterium]|nr:hypothetical protein [Defluviitaleaceae bacterium]MCL2199296.1 hypothetical protein [Defluviitaleaceae bacterium]
MNISGFAPSIFSNKVAEMKEREKVVFVVNDNDDKDDDDYDCMASNLRTAVEAYQDKILRGLMSLSDEEVQERIAEFIAMFMPQEPYTVDQMDAFKEALAAFEQNLLNLQEETNKGNERLLTSSAENDDEGDYARSLLPSNPLLQNALRGYL